jgi:hypothetical protein
MAMSLGRASTAARHLTTSRLRNLDRDGDHRRQDRLIWGQVQADDLVTLATSSAPVAHARTWVERQDARARLIFPRHGR